MSFIGTAGWAIPAPYRQDFPQQGSQLERYATVLNAVEINSSFYRPHKRKTYERWSASVPSEFRFSVKLPKTITQDRRLANCRDLIDKFLSEVSGLGSKLGMLLVQLPPSLEFDAKVAEFFFEYIGKAGYKIACEPRNITWFERDAESMMQDHGVARVAADPPRAPNDGKPGGASKAAYWRLHGSPEIYYSNYDDKALRSLAPKLHNNDWCIFDNTAALHALGNAIQLAKLKAEKA